MGWWHVLFRIVTPKWLWYVPSKGWNELGRRAEVTGVAREEKVLFRFGRYRLVRQREVRLKGEMSGNHPSSERDADGKDQTRTEAKP